MRKTISIFIFLFLLSDLNGQIKKGTLQAGISALPIIDVFKLYPENKTAGTVLIGNFGTFISKELSFGIMPYYGRVSNEYTSADIDQHRERQDLNAIGLNTYLRYNWSTDEKLKFFAFVSAGFGDLQLTTINLSTKLQNKSANGSILTFLPGAGLNYLFSKNIAVELNLSYIFFRNLSPATPVPDFATLVPTLGLQFYFPNNPQ